VVLVLEGLAMPTCVPRAWLLAISVRKRC